MIMQDYLQIKYPCNYDETEQNDEQGGNNDTSADYTRFLVRIFEGKHRWHLLERVQSEHMIFSPDIPQNDKQPGPQKHACKRRHPESPMLGGNADHPSYPQNQQLK